MTINRWLEIDPALVRRLARQNRKKSRSSWRFRSLLAEHLESRLPLAAEIAVFDSPLLLTDGGSVNIGTTAPSSPVVKTLTVRNLGDAALSLTSLNAASFPTGFSLVSNFADTNLAPGENTTFSVQLLSATSGSFSGQIAIENTDADEGPFNLELYGVVTTTPDAVVTILDDGDVGTTTTAGWTTSVGGYQGDVRLAASGSGSEIATWEFRNLPNGYYHIWVTYPASGQRPTDATYKILDATSPRGDRIVNQQNAPNDLSADGVMWKDVGFADIFDGPMRVSLNNATNGTTVAADGVRIQRAGNLASVTQFTVDDGDANYSTEGNWSVLTGDGYANDMRAAPAGTGASISKWSFNVSPGRYRVLATYSAAAQRASNAPFTILNGNVSVGTTLVNQKVAPDDYSDGFNSWEIVGNEVSITASNLSVQLTNNANGQVVADSIRIERIGDLIMAPEIDVLDGSIHLADGGPFYFGETPPNVPLDKTLTVRNLGATNLILTPINAASLPAGFSLVSNFGSTTLGPNEATTFTVRLQSATGQTYSGPLVFNNNDADENPFNLNLTGVVTGTVPTAIDNGDAGYATTGSWSLVTGAGYDGDYQYSAAGTGADVATWLFHVTPGRYEVAATWVPHANRATNAPFRVFNDAALLNTVNINQELTPDDVIEDGAGWERLGGPYDITGNSLVVKLSDNANEYVIADGVGIRRIGDLVVAPEIVVLDGASNLTDGGTLNFGSAAPGVAINKTLTVQNLGSANLTLTPINAASLPAGYSLVSNFGSTTLAPSTTTTFTLRLQSNTAQTYSGPLAFNNNDSDENPFNLNLTGAVVAAPVVTIIDDGSAGYVSAGAWTNAAGYGGYQNDYQYNAAGSGADVATWTFNVTPGRYEVSTTWTPHANRATNAPYRIFNGATLLNTVNINQEPVPNDFNDAGVAWERLAGPYDITGNSLVVKLADNANEYVIADAVRIERVAEPVPAPEIALLDGAANLSDGGTLNFGNTAPGVAVDKTITVQNLGTANLTLTAINGASLPAGYSLVSNFGSTNLAPNATTTFTLRLQSATAQTYSGSLAFNNNDSDENPFHLNLTGVVLAAAAPEIALLDGVANLADNGTLNFGSTAPGVAVDKTITVQNLGSANLTLTAINAASLPAGYSLVSNFGSTNLAPNATTTFTLRLQSATAQTYSGPLAFNNNDGDENPFHLNLTGVVLAAPMVTIIDDGSAGYVSTGAWTNAAGYGGYQNDYQYSAAGTGADVATWTFNVTPGRYEVSTTWTIHANRATNAPYRIFNGGTLLNTVNINQESLPNDFNDAGVAWEKMAGPYNITGNSLVVKLADNANEYVIADAVRIERIGDLVVAPEIAVLDGGTNLADGGTLNFGSTAPGAAVDKTLTVQNLGTSNLTLTPINAASLPTGYSLVSNFGSTNLAPSATTTFTLRLQSATAQTYSGPLAFNNNDSDENPFHLNLTGVVAVAPVVAIIDDGSAGYVSTGAWTNAAGYGGYQNDYQYSTAGTGADVATWTFNVTPGRYEVSTTWTPHANRATNAPYRIFNGATLLNTVNVNQEPAPNDFNDAGVAWEKLAGPYNITGNSLVVKLADNANEYVIADAVRIERIGDLVVAPEIAVLDGATNLADGGTLNFGSTAPGVAINKTLTVQNLGTANLTLTPINGVSLPTGYSLVSNFDSTNLAPGTTTTFTLRLQSATAQTYSGPLAFNNNDADENPFNLNLTGVVAVAPVVTIIDDGSAGYVSTGAWTNAAGYGGYQNDYQYSTAGTGADVATWTFNVTPGRYEVATTWTPHANRATNAPYRIFNGATLLNTVNINQEPAPNDFNDAGVAWEKLAGPYNITGNSLVVKLADNANEYVIADAVRIERIGDLVVAPEIAVRDGGTNLADGGTLNFGSTAPGVAVDKTLTVQNVGTADLNLTAINAASLPTGYSLVSNFGSTNLAPNATTTFTLRLQSATAQTYSGPLAFNNNDSDENPFNLNLTGVVAVVPASTIIDDGAAGYTTTGTWSPVTGAGYQNDYQFNVAGTGADVATWTFSVTPGRYDVAATWVPHANRATNAPYRVFDGATLLNTVNMNQEAVPNDFNDAGVAWERLAGPYDISGTSLVVKLADNANEYVIADAIRIERVETGQINVSPTSGLVTNENGSTASFTVVLGSQPSANVVIGVGVSDNSEGSVAPTSLTFTPGNWNAPQHVVVTGKDDLIDDGTISYLVVTSPAVSADPKFNAVNPADVSVNNADNGDQAGFLIAPLVLTTTEAGGQATFQVSLTSQPIANVQLGIMSSNAAEGTAAPTPLIFTPQNWNVPQTVTVTGVDDAVADGPVQYNVLTGPATSTDGKYHGLNPADPSVTNADNDAAGISINLVTANRTTEAGGTARVRVVLTSQPTTNVTIPVSSSDTTEGSVSTGSLVFTPANWNAPQEVTVTGVDDPVDDGDVNYAVVIEAAVSGDPIYSGRRPVPQIGLVNEDNDTAALVLDPQSGIQAKEGGPTGGVAVRLASQPTAAVTVSVSINVPSQANLSTNSLTFTPGNWNQSQNVTITAIDDTDLDGDIPFVLTTTVTASTDSGYLGKSGQATGMIADNDQTPAIKVRVLSHTTTESADIVFSSFYVQLNTQPTANVSIPITVGDATEGQLRSATGGPSPSVTLIFTAANWNTEQYVNIYGKDDNECDGDVTYAISVGAATSGDAAYNGRTGSSVTVVNRDNEVCRFNGSYSGSYSGDDAGPVAVTVNQGAITVTLPFGGSGSVDQNGVVAFGVVTGGGATCNFGGSMATTTDGASNASGTWVCPAAGMSGTWTVSRTSPLFASVPPQTENALPPLSPTDAQRLAEMAWTQWQVVSDVAVDSSMVLSRAAPDIVVVDLPGDQLGAADGNTIYIDTDGAGYGWFVDPTPNRDEEFEWHSPGGNLRARTGSAASNRFDLLSVLAHEIGHVLGLPDVDPQAVDQVMAALLPPGTRRLPWASDVDAVMTAEDYR